VALGREAGAEGAVLDRAVQLLQPPQQIEQAGGIVGQAFGQGS